MDEFKITKETQIHEILEHMPEKAQILLDVGMHCLECPVSAYETLEEACAVHYVDVDEVVEALNKKED